jgi:hypothetical protein
MAITSLATLGSSNPQQFKLYNVGNGSLASGPRQRFFTRVSAATFPQAVNSAANPQTAASNGVPFTNPTGTDLTYLSSVDFTGNPYGTSTGNSKYIVVIDVLWSVLLSSVTTLQTINTGTLPARDINGATDGDGVYFMLAKDDFNTGNTAGTCTVSYTNSSGTSGRSSVISYPGNLGGNIMLIGRVDTGDVGTRSVQTVQFSTSVGGIYIVLFRPIAFVQMGTSRTTDMDEDAISLGLPRVYDNSCIHGFFGGANNYSGNITLSQG